MAARGHDKVAITGASGFLGSCIVKELLIRGYRVVGTVREPGNAQKTQHLTTLPHANTHLALVQADLIASEVDRFIEAFRGCRAVLHTASPFFLDSPSKDSLLKPALLGTEKILKAVQACPSVRKLIVTSSTAAIYGDFGTKGPAHIYTEEDWSLTEKLRAQESWYALGKTLAERSVYDFMAKLGDQAHFTVATINPTWILGPMLQPQLNESSRKIYNYLAGVIKEIPNASKTLVDVRDVALAHVLAMEQEDATGRYLLIADSPFEEEIVAILRDLEPNNTLLPTKVSPATGQQTTYGPMQPARYSFNCEKARKLGVHFTSTRDMMEATIQSLRQHKIIP